MNEPFGHGECESCKAEDVDLCTDCLCCQSCCFCDEDEDDAT